MSTAAEVLLIVVSSVLSLFLILAVVATVKIVQILNDLRQIVHKAERIADSAEAAAELFRKSAGPVALSRMVANIVESVKDHVKEDKRKR